MPFVEEQRSDGISTLTLRRGKVNALNADVVVELRVRLAEIETDPAVSSVVLTGAGTFFSFGFDIPELLPYSPEAFAGYLREFTDLCTTLFLFPKPVVAAINGHAIAGGCMLALGCDRRVMADGHGRIGLNEIAFGSSVFAGTAAMLRFWTSGAAATEIFDSGAMWSAAEARRLGIVDAVVGEDALAPTARGIAGALGARSPAAFASLKRLLRGPVADEIHRREPTSIDEFVGIWYSPSVRESLAKITIRS